MKTKLFIFFACMVASVFGDQGTIPFAGGGSVDTNLSVNTLTAATRVTTPEVTLNGTTRSTWPSFSFTISDSGATFAGATSLVQSSSASAATFYKVAGESGIYTRVENNTLVFSGNATGSVSALFPGAVGYASIYFRPYNASAVQSITALNVTNTAGRQYLSHDGTNFVMDSGTAGLATNATLFDSQPSSYYRNHKNQTNFAQWDAGFLGATAQIFDWGDNLSATAITYTNDGIVYAGYKINAGASTGLSETADSVWTGSNRFAQTLYAKNFYITGDGNNMSGSKASIGIGSTNNTATGANSTVAGGKDNQALGSLATIGGGQGNVVSASITGGTAAGGKDNQVLGDYGVVVGGQQNQAGQYASVLGGFYAYANANNSLVAGEYVNVTNERNFAYAFGQGITQQIASATSNTVWIDHYNTNIEMKFALNASSAGTNTARIVGSLYADTYLGSFYGDISQASGAPVASNSQWTLKSDYSTNTTTRELVIVGAIITNVISAGTTSTVYLGAGNVGTFTNITVLTSNHTASIVITNGAGVRITDNGTVMTIINDWNPTTNGYITEAIASNSFYVLSENETVTGRPTFTNAFVVGGGTLDATNATVRGKTPVDGADFATKSYVDSSAAAYVTNAMSRALANSGSLQTGLTTLNIIDPDITLSSAGGTATYTRATANVSTNNNQTYQAGTTQNVYSVTIHTNGSIGMRGYAIEPKNIFIQHSAPGSIGTNTIGSTVIGGSASTIGANSDSSTIIGSDSSTITSGDNNFIGGGNNHTIVNSYNAIIGGQNADINGQYNSVLGGLNNDPIGNGNFNTIAGGQNNAMSTAYHSFIGAGTGNDINSADDSAIVAGENNLIENATGLNFIGAGAENRIYGYHSTIVGAYGNSVYSDLSHIIGAYSMATGGLHQIAMGPGAYSRHSGSVVMSGHSATPSSTNIASTTTNQLVASFPGGIGLQTNIAPAGGVNIGGTFQLRGIRQPICLGYFTNANPTTIVPVGQGDYYIDAGSNTVVRTFDGTTNGYRFTTWSSF